MNDVSPKPSFQEEHVPFNDAVTRLPPRRWVGGLMLVGGIFPLIFAVMMTEMTGRTIFLHLNRDKYVRSEFILDGLVVDTEQSRMLGRVALTNEEILMPHVATELYLFDSPSAVVGRLPSPEAVKGRRLSIWYNPQGKKLLWDMRVVFLSEWSDLPRAGTVARMVAVQATLAAVGLVGVVRGAKRLRRPAVPDTANFV